MGSEDALQEKALLRALRERGGPSHLPPLDPVVGRASCKP